MDLHAGRQESGRSCVEAVSSRKVVVALNNFCQAARTSEAGVEEREEAEEGK